MPKSQAKPTRSGTTGVQLGTSKAETPVKKRPASKAVAKQVSTKNVPSRKHSQNDPVAGVWTPTISKHFYGNINSLSNKLKDYQIPRVPENYRVGNNARAVLENPGDYTLSYEEELHLADHFAFLAHVPEGVEYVSAVTIEESRDPPMLVVRLASNHTPTTYVREGLENILQIVREHARQGRHGQEHKMRLFDKVVTFSQERIYSRLRCSRWEKPPRIKDPTPPLYVQIESHLSKLGNGPLRSSLADLVTSLRKVDSGADEDQIEILKEVIAKSNAVSHEGDAKSLEAALRGLRIGETICESRAVLEIDKLSKYLDLCHDLIRLSRQPTTRLLCQDLKLEICSSYPESRPVGAKAKCFVHAEVQLILFYERYPKQPPPRAIGASKSACFLCDLFIKHHRRFGISHSHMKLYPQWTLPETVWMDSRQIQLLQSIVQAMDVEIEEMLGKKTLYRCNAVIESRAHILQIIQGSELASSIASPTISEPQLVRSSDIQTPTELPVPTVDPAPAQMTSTLYHYEDLPISMKILADTVSCKCLVGEVEYIFDLAEVETGQLLVSERDEAQMVPEAMRINVMELSSLPRHLKAEGVSQSITFYAHDSERHELQITMIWDMP